MEKAEQLRLTKIGHYRCLSPTKRTKEDALNVDKVHDKFLKRLDDLEGKVQGLMEWKAKVQARQLVTEFHRKKGKSVLASMLKSLICKYKEIEAKNQHLPLWQISCIFHPKKFMEEVRWQMEVKKWLEGPARNDSAPPMCVNRRSLMLKLNVQMLTAVDQVLAAHHIPLDYKSAVTLYYNKADVGVDKDAILALGNQFINSLVI